LKKKIEEKIPGQKFRNIKGAIKGQDVFNHPSRLSLKSDSFVLMEYIEKDPLILSNFGMVSKIERWIYITRLASYVLRKHGYNPGKG